MIKTHTLDLIALITTTIGTFVAFLFVLVGSFRWQKIWGAGMLFSRRPGWRTRAEEPKEYWGNVIRYLFVFAALTFILAQVTLSEFNTRTLSSAQQGAPTDAASPGPRR
jgi:hypothetical protein